MSIKPMGTVEWLMLILLSLLWGGSFFFMKIASVELPVLSIVLVRVFLAALSLYAYIKIRAISIAGQWKYWKLFFYIGLFNNVVPFSLLIFGISEIGSALAAILNATTPLFTIVVAHLYTNDEKISLAKLSGVFLGVVGVGVLVGGNGMLENGSVLAVLACLGAALSYAIASMVGRKLAALKLDAASTSFGQVTASSLLLLPAVLWIDTPWQLSAPSSIAVLALIALGVLSTALAYVLFFKLIARAGATNAVLVTLLVPVSAMVLGVMLLDEVISMHQVIGMALISVGLAAIDGRLLQRLSFKRAQKLKASL